MAKKSLRVVDIFRMKCTEITDLGKSLRRKWIAGHQWIVLLSMGGDSLVDHKTFSSFDGAVAFAIERTKGGMTVRIDGIRCFLKILNHLPQLPFDVAEHVELQEMVDRYPKLVIPARAVFSQPVLLNDFFPVIYRQTVSFLDPVWVVPIAEGQDLDCRILERQGLRCENLAEGLRKLEDTASGHLEREPGESTILVGEAVTAGRKRQLAIFYKIGPRAAVGDGKRLPIIQFVDPTQEYFEDQLLFGKYDREENLLIFFDGQLKRTNFEGGIKLHGLEFWSPRPLYLAEK